LIDQENIKIPWQDKKCDDMPKTRTQLLEIRKREKVPDISYDLDKDGFVGGRDYLLSKRFDFDKDGKLNEIEKKLAYEAIHNNIEDKYLWNLENHGPNNKLRVLQKRGKILQADDFTPNRETYPQHPLSSKIPKHETYQKLKESRKMSTKLDVEEKMRKWEEVNPTVLVSEPLNINMEYKPKYNSIKEKKEEEHKLARIECGLSEVEHDVDKRKNKELSLNYVKNPKFKTRADLKNEYRKEIMTQLNKSNNPNHKDETMRLKEREDEIFAMLYKNSEDRMSQSKLKEIRKNERIDYNMKTFSKQTIGVHGHELPKFSENEEMKEYWKFRDGYVENPHINSHVLYKEHVKYWKKPEELLINEHQDELLSPEYKKDKVISEKKDNLIIKVNNLNHFKDRGFDPDNPRPIDIDEIPKNHIYKYYILVRF
jgi:hypothetical protein